MSDVTLTVVVTLLVVAILPLCWWGVVSLLGALGNWQTLAAVYRAPDGKPVPDIPCWAGQKCTLRTAFSFDGVDAAELESSPYALRICIDPRGLWLARTIFFRPGHPPLLVPWSEITARVGTGVFGALKPRVELRFARTPHVALCISQPLAEAVAEASEGALRLDPVSGESRGQAFPGPGLG